MLETFEDRVSSIESRVSRIEKQGFLEYAKTRKGFEETIYFSKEEYSTAHTLSASVSRRSLSHGNIPP